MSWKGDLIKAGIYSDGKDINIWRGDLTVYGDIVYTGGVSIAGDVSFTGKFAMGTQGSGIAITSSAPHLMQVHTLPVVDLDDYTSSFGIRSRYEVSTNQTNIVTLEAIDGRFRPKANLGQGNFVGVHGHVEGDGTFTFAGTADSIMCAGHFTVELDTSVTLTSGRVMGVGIDSAVNGSLDVSNATYTGLRIWTGSGREPWTYGITIAGCVTGIDIVEACTAAINVSVIQTASGGLDVTNVLGHGTWSTPLVYGVMDGHTIFRSVSITASTDSYIMGDVFKFLSTATSTGTVVGHYNYVTLAHNTAATYNYYGRLVISTDAVITAAECMLLTVDVSSGVTLGTTGHLSGLHVAMTVASDATDIATGVETVGVYVQTSGIAKDVTGGTIGIKVEHGGGSNYLDYGLQFSNCFESATAIIHMQLTQGNHATGMLFEVDNGHTLASAFTFKDNADGAVTYFADFSATAGNENTAYEKDANAATSIEGKIMIKDSDGDKGYVNVYATAN
ncbi:hypothetical protein KAR91_34465 [Candidatus Pacearchaeota archaeon]|nr:hypothetical protein [Candidatus Pacearchaeota archaeon]